MGSLSLHQLTVSAEAFPPAKEGSVEKCSPDLEYQESCEYQQSPFIVKSHI